MTLTGGKVHMIRCIRPHSSLRLLGALSIFSVLVLAPFSYCPGQDAALSGEAPLQASVIDNQLTGQGDNEFGDVTEEEMGEERAENESLRIADPLEPWNRAVFKVNDRLYFWLLKPVAKGYKAVVPEGFRVIFSNFYKNLSAPVRIANNLLQLRVAHAGNELARFAVNSTLGIGGLRNLAGDCFGMATYEADFGQTLGFYGLGQGFYLVWPVIGPSSARDSVGFAADIALYPVTWVAPTDLSTGASAHTRVNSLSFRLGEYEALKKAAIDPYAAVRNAYAQHRAAVVNRAKKAR